MRARRATLAVLAAALLSVAPALLGAQPKFITITDPSVFTNPSRAAVEFTHEYHTMIPGKNCLTCHHVYKGGKNVLDPSTLVEGNAALRCASCHATPAALQKAFHLQCITCHDAERRKGNLKAPWECGECHAGAKK
jgi:hypothetical protein